MNEHATAYDQTFPSVAMTASGAFVLAYTSVDATAGTTQVYYRRYDSNAMPQGDERPVHEALGENQTAASVGISGDGSFVIAYQHNHDATLGWDVSAQRFTAQGTAIGGLINARLASPADELWASVAVQANGSFVLSWTGVDNDQHGVFAHQFDATGAFIRELQLTQLTANDQMIWWSALAPRPDGGFVATWMEWSPDTSWDVKARAFASDGTPVTAELPASVPTTQFQGYSTVAVDPNGGFLVAWMDSGKDGDGWGIYGQQYDNTGNKVGSETRLTDASTGDQMWARVAADGVGNFITAWSTTSTDGTGLNIAGQRVYAGGGRIGNGVVVNPGHDWDDADINNGTPATVLVRNLLGSSVPIVVSGGAGMASISPVGSGPFLNVFVMGNVAWTGDFSGRLQLSAGDVSDISIKGDLDLYAGGSVGNVAAGNVIGLWGQSVGDGTASGFVNIIGGVTHVGHVSAGGSVGTVISDGDLAGVHAGADIGMPALDIPTGLQPVSWPVDVWWNWHSGERQTISARTAITGPISAVRDISAIASLADLSVPISAGGRIGEIYASGELTSTIAAGSVGNVTGYESVDSIVSSTGGIDSVRSNGDVAGTFEAAGRIGEISSGGAIHAYISAGLDIGLVSATTDLSATITAGGRIDAASALGVLAGAITAGDIGYLTGILGVACVVDSRADIASIYSGSYSAGIITGSYHADGRIETVGGGFSPLVDAQLAAGAGIGSIQSGDLRGNVSTDGSIGRIWAYDIAASIWAGGNIDLVSGWSIAGTVHADGDIGRPLFSAYPSDGLVADGTLSATVSAGQDIYYVTVGESITGSIGATRDIGLVQANQSLTGSIDAGRDIGIVMAGDNLWFGPPSIGNVGGTIDAGRDILSVSASQDVIASISAGRHIGTVADNQSTVWWVYEVYPAIIDGVTADRAIDATIQAVGNISRVAAGNESAYSDAVTAIVSGEIDAQGTIGLVAAFGGTLAATVTSGGTVTELFSTADITGPVTATGQIEYVTGLRDLTGTVEAGPGKLTGYVGRTTTGRVTAGQIVLTVDGDFLGVMNATGQGATLDAGSVNGVMSAAESLTVHSNSTTAGSMTADTVTVDSLGAVTGYITGRRSVVITGWEGVGAEINATAGSVLIDAHGDVGARVSLAPAM